MSHSTSHQKLVEVEEERGNLENEDNAIEDEPMLVGRLTRPLSVDSHSKSVHNTPPNQLTLSQVEYSLGFNALNISESYSNPPSLSWAPSTFFARFSGPDSHLYGNPPFPPTIPTTPLPADTLDRLIDEAHSQLAVQAHANNEPHLPLNPDVPCVPQLRLSQPFSLLTLDHPNSWVDQVNNKVFSPPPRPPQIFRPPDLWNSQLH